MNDFERRIRDAAAEIPGIAALLVFGSRARGTARPDSDLDVAVLPTAGGEIDASAQGLERNLQVRLAVALADFAPDGRVDVVRLDRAPAALRQQVMVDGRMILCRDPAAWKALRVKTMREYGDQAWMRRSYQDALRRRLLERRPSGRSVGARQPLEHAR